MPTPFRHHLTFLLRGNLLLSVGLRQSSSLAPQEPTLILHTRARGGRCRGKGAGCAERADSLSHFSLLIASEGVRAGSSMEVQMFALAPTHLASHSLGKKKKKKKPTKKQDNRICNSCNKLQCVLSVLLPDAQNNLVSCALQWQCSVTGV